MKNRIFIFVYVALIVGVALAWYFNKYVGRRTTAAQDAVSITLNPDASTFEANTQKDIDVIIQSPDAVKKISGIDLIFNATGPIKFIKVSNPSPFPGTDTSLFNSVVENVANQTLHLSYVSLKTDAELPSILHFQITIEGTGEGLGKITLDQSNSQVVGNIVGKLYAFGSVQEGSYTIIASNSARVSADFTPSPLSLNVGEQGVEYLTINGTTGDQRISGFHFVYTYDPNIIEVSSIDAPIDASTGGDANKFVQVKKDINATTGTVDITYVSTLSQDLLPKQPMLTMHLLGKQVGQGQFTIVNNEVTGNVPGNAYLVNTYAGVYNVNSQVTACNTNTDCEASYFCSSSKICEPLNCSPAVPLCKMSVISNHQCVLANVTNGTSCGNGMVCNNGQCVNGSLTPTITTTVCQTNDQCSTTQICNPNLQICENLICNIQTPVCQHAVARNHSCVFDPDLDGTACTGGTCQSGSCVPGGVSPSPTPLGNIRLNMKLKLQGILKMPAAPRPIRVKVTVAGGGLGSNTVTRTVTFTSNESGVWTGNTAVNAPAGSGYKIFVKGPQHLQKRICNSLPTETATGTYRCGDAGLINLQNGDNSLDFSGITMLTGDIPDQDGIVDSYDLAYLILSFGSTDPKSLAIGDMNQDGLIDTQDYSLVIASLSVKYDEI